MLTITAKGCDKDYCDFECRGKRDMCNSISFPKDETQDFCKKVYIGCMRKCCSKRRRRRRDLRYNVETLLLKYPLLRGDTKTFKTEDKESKIGQQNRIEQ